MSLAGVIAVVLIGIAFCRLVWCGDIMVHRNPKVMLGGDYRLLLRHFAG
jgi:hypothetical protein